MAAPKTRARSTHDIETALIEAALALVADKPWREIALADIAGEAKIGLAELRRTATDKAAILATFQRRLDAAALAGVAEDPADDDDSPRDRLFDILMQRFDALNVHRAGAVALARAARKDAGLAAFGLSSLARSMAWMADAAGLPVDGVKGRLRVKALTGLYALTLRDWTEDDSPDMSRVMAALDARLRKLENAPGAWLSCT